VGNHQQFQEMLTAAAAGMFIADFPVESPFAPEAVLRSGYLPEE
jgi:hypothetical protein